MKGVFFGEAGSGGKFSERAESDGGGVFVGEAGSGGKF